MTKRRTRRAPSADYLAMSPEDRKAVQNSRIRQQMPSHYRDLRTAGEPFPTAQSNDTSETKK